MFYVHVRAIYISISMAISCPSTPGSRLRPAPPAPAQEAPLRVSSFPGFPRSRAPESVLVIKLSDHLA